MEWKPYYDAELSRLETRDKIANWLQLAYESDSLSATIENQIVFSFPHTAVDYSGILQTRVVSWLYRKGFKQVIALGVTHGSLIPEYQVATDKLASQQERADAFAQVSGGFLPAKRLLETPFGTHPIAAFTEPLPDGIQLDTVNLLQNEFSLDTFHAVMRLAADVFQVAPLSITPLYVGMMRNPISGSFKTAIMLADWLRSQWDAETAIVTTGDVVHYGAVYGSKDEGSVPEQLESQFRTKLKKILTTAFEQRDLENAYQLSSLELKSDQREILPVLAYMLGAEACAELLAFELSDYSGIFDTVTPCLVASALIAYKRRNAARLTKRISE